MLKGVRLAVAHEQDEGEVLQESLIKTLTGGDPVSARYMHGSPFEFEMCSKLLLYANEKPKIMGADESTWRRIRLIPFNVRIEDVTKKDEKFRYALKDEASGILNWALEGCLEYLRDGLGEAPAVQQATQAYRHEQDVVGRFIEEQIVRDLGMTETKRNVFTRFKAWIHEQGLPDISGVKFSLGMKRNLVDDGKNVKGDRTWTGVRLKA